MQTGLKSKTLPTISKQPLENSRNGPIGVFSILFLQSGPGKAETYWQAFRTNVYALIFIVLNFPRMFRYFSNTATPFQKSMPTHILTCGRNTHKDWTNSYGHNSLHPIFTHNGQKIFIEFSFWWSFTSEIWTETRGRAWHVQRRHW